MDVFQLRDGLIDDYSSYAESFLNIGDERVREHVDTALAAGKLWPAPQVGLNPAFESGGLLSDFESVSPLHDLVEPVFRFGKSETDPGVPLSLHRHQADAIEQALAGKNYVLTTGTGSGKSLGYIIPIVNHVLNVGSGGGVKAIIVYPMNALANSQRNELEKFLNFGPWSTSPVTFARYTGQEQGEERDELLNNPPDILLTNYVMLEYILTRVRDRELVNSFSDLRFVVLDELHTYRGRQGADVALLVRRLREAAGSPNLQCVGTSATMSTEGGFAEQQARVAEVASLLFGAEVLPESVIGETLMRSTVERDFSDPVTKAELRDRLNSGVAPALDHASFCSDPLSSWVESTFGLTYADGRLSRVVPIALEGEDGGAKRLAALTGVDEKVCSAAIKEQLMIGYTVFPPGGRLPVFAFRLHQFISRGDTVYCTPEAPADRFIQLNPQRYVPGERERALFPLGFCRSCGQDYYVVTRFKSADGVSELVAREIFDQGADVGYEAGYLFLSDDRSWRGTSVSEDNLPDEWFEVRGDVRKLKSSAKKNLPKRFAVFPNGLMEPLADSAPCPSSATQGWWVQTPFRFCLACGVSHDARGKDFPKIGTLGSEGRSTATTILTIAALQRLRAEETGLDPEAKKLLSFTDNRQDASLQSGHLNDFVQVTLLRSALYRALEAAGPAGLGFSEVAGAVANEIGVPFEEYALVPDQILRGREQTESVFRRVISYRLYVDLRRGWRINQPNLEQCGLLRVEYESLEELAATESVWAESDPVLALAGPELRVEICKTLLDHMRRALAIDSAQLEVESQESLKGSCRSSIAEGPWNLDQEQLENSVLVIPRPESVVVRPKNFHSRISGLVPVSSRGVFARYLNRPGVLGGEGHLDQGRLESVIDQIFDALRKGGLVVTKQSVPNRESGEEIPLFQVPEAAIRWVVGDGESAYHDVIRMPQAPDAGLESNRYFVDLYRAVGSRLVGVNSAEHTAQVSYDERIKREADFRKADLPILFCSPTMELGVDISQLNVVSLRNVPPTPANYAQRSGRAGRSGQPALVFTYCSIGSSHDQYFFMQPEKMVAGMVEAPRLELANEDLVRSHVHAVWLTESELDLGSSMSDVLDLEDDDNDPALQDHVVNALGNESSRARAKARCEVVFADIARQFQDSIWWTEGWFDQVLNDVEHSFRSALYRWKALYKAAMQQAIEQSRLRRSAEKNRREQQMAETLVREANRQLDLLKAQSDSRGQSDFYTYRYLASEGFLPGYSFPRLPLSAFISGRRGRSDDPEYLQRPRFLAISEFGPQSLIYHEGERYRINRVILPVGDLESGGQLPLVSAKWCEECGYLHPIESGPGPDVCERCSFELPAAMPNLFRMENVATRRQDRISSDEEERQRQGYELRTGVHFAKRGGLSSVRSAEIVSPLDSVLGHLEYGDTATIWRVNLGWRRRKDRHRKGFVLDVQRGYWEKNESEADHDEQDPTANRRVERVIPYVRDSRNTLLFRPVADLGFGVMAALQSALKSAIQTVFQLEENEVAAEPLPNRDDRRVLLIYESAEGGAGVLRRLVEEPELFARVARTALERIHVDPDTGEDRVERGDDSVCEAACYRCLMSYQNQMDHRLLDRRAIVGELMALAECRVKKTAASISIFSPSLESPDVSAESVPSQSEPLTDPAPEVADEQDGSVAADKKPELSDLAPRFIAELERNGFKMPDRELFTFKMGATPDYVYDAACAVVYLDGVGPRRDIELDSKFNDAGYRVIRFGHPDDWAQSFDTHQAVFGEGNNDDYY